MDMIEARRVRTGDSVVYEGRAQAVLQISDDGLWSPYFDLERDGFVSYLLVEPVAATPAALASA